MAGLTIKVDQENMKLARALGPGRSLTEGKPHALLSRVWVLRTLSCRAQGPR